MSIPVLILACLSVMVLLLWAVAAKCFNQRRRALVEELAQVAAERAEQRVLILGGVGGEICELLSGETPTIQAVHRANELLLGAEQSLGDLGEVQAFLLASAWSLRELGSSLRSVLLDSAQGRRNLIAFVDETANGLLSDSELRAAVRSGVLLDLPERRLRDEAERISQALKAWAEFLEVMRRLEYLASAALREPESMDALRTALAQLQPLPEAPSEPMCFAPPPKSPLDNSPWVMAKVVWIAKRAAELAFGTRDAAKSSDTGTQEPWANNRHPVIDLVHFSVTGPPSVAVGDKFLLDVWLYLEQQRAEVERRAREAVTEKGLFIRQRGPVSIPRGTPIALRVNVERLIIDDPEDTILWAGEISVASFAIRVPKDCCPGSVLGISFAFSAASSRVFSGSL